MVVIPWIAAYASGALGAVAIGTATAGAYLTVAAAALSTVGALSGNKDLSRIGAIMSLGAGIANWANAANAGADASSAWNAADSAAGSDAAQFSKYAQPASETGTATQQVIDEAAKAGAQQVVEDAAQTAAANEAGSFDTTAVDAAPLNTGSPIDPNAGIDYPSGEVFGEQGGRSLWDVGQANAQAPQGATPFGMPTTSDLIAQSAQGMTTDQIAGLTQRATPIPTAVNGTPAGQQLRLGNMGTAGNTTVPQIKIGETAGDSIMGRINSLGQHVKNNKELYQIGGQMLQGMFGPEAEQMDWQKSLYERRRRNLNNPVRMTYGG